VDFFRLDSKGLFPCEKCGERSGKSASRALMVVPVQLLLLLPVLSGLWSTTLLIESRGEGHQGYSATVFTWLIDLFPSEPLDRGWGRIGGWRGAGSGAC